MLLRPTTSSRMWLSARPSHRRGVSQKDVAAAVAEQYTAEPGCRPAR